MKQLTDKQQQEKIVLEATLERWLGLYDSGIQDDKVKGQIYCYASKYFQLTGEYYHRGRK